MTSMSFLREPAPTRSTRSLTVSMSCKPIAWPFGPLAGFFGSCFWAAGCGDPLPSASSRVLLATLIGDLSRPPPPHTASRATSSSPARTAAKRRKSCGNGMRSSPDRSPRKQTGRGGFSARGRWKLDARLAVVGLLPAAAVRRLFSCLFGGWRYGAGDGPAQVTVDRVADGVQTKTPGRNGADCGRGESRDAGNEPAQNRVYHSDLSCQANNTRPQRVGCGRVLRKSAGCPYCRHGGIRGNGRAAVPVIGCRLHAQKPGGRALSTCRRWHATSSASRRRQDANARAGGCKKKSRRAGGKLSGGLPLTLPVAVSGDRRYRSRLIGNAASDPEAGDGSADAIDAKPGGLLAVLGANDPAARVVQPALPERS